MSTTVTPPARLSLRRSAPKVLSPAVSPPSSASTADSRSRKTPEAAAQLQRVQQRRADVRAQLDFLAASPGTPWSFTSPGGARRRSSRPRSTVGSSRRHASRSPQLAALSDGDLGRSRTASPSVIDARLRPSTPQLQSPAVHPSPPPRGSAGDMFSYMSTGLRQYAPQRLWAVDNGWYCWEADDGAVQHVHAESGFMQDASPYRGAARVTEATRRRMARKQVQQHIQFQLAVAARAEAAAQEERERERAEAERAAREADLALRTSLRVVGGVSNQLRRQGTRVEDANRRQLLAAQRIQALARGALARRQFKTRLCSPIKVFVLLGGPGAGKSTYSSRLVEEFEPVQHVSIGELLRLASTGPVATQHAHAAQMRVAMKEGNLVPNNVVLDVMETALKRLRFRRAHEGLTPPVVLLDNFPLTEDQRVLWQKHPHLPHFAGIFYLDCAEQTMIDRVVERGKVSGRTDDNEASVATAIARFNTYCKDGVVQHYESAGKLVKIDAEQPAAAGYQEMRAAIMGSEVGAFLREHGGVQMVTHTAAFRLKPS
jgi:adenylate kinase